MTERIGLYRVESAHPWDDIEMMMQVFEVPAAVLMKGAICFSAPRLCADVCLLADQRRERKN